VARVGDDPSEIPDVIDIQAERLFPVRNPPRDVSPILGEKWPHPATLYRWAKCGLHGVKLETLRVGGTLCTSLEALQRFCERLTASTTAPTQPPAASPTARRRSHERAGRALDRLGI